MWNVECECGVASEHYLIRTLAFGMACARINISGARRMHEFEEGTIKMRTIYAELEHPEGYYLL